MAPQFVVWGEDSTPGSRPPPIILADSGGPGGLGPLAPKIVSKSRSFQEFFEKPPIFSKFWAQGPPWPKCWILDLALNHDANATSAESQPLGIKKKVKFRHVLSFKILCPPLKVHRALKKKLVSWLPLFGQRWRENLRKFSCCSCDALKLPSRPENTQHWYHFFRWNHAAAQCTCNNVSHETCRSAVRTGHGQVATESPAGLPGRFQRPYLHASEPHSAILSSRGQQELLFSDELFFGAFLGGESRSAWGLWSKSYTFLLSARDQQNSFLTCHFKGPKASFWILAMVTSRNWPNRNRKQLFRDSILKRRTTVLVGPCTWRKVLMNHWSLEVFVAGNLKGCEQHDDWLDFRAVCTGAGCCVPALRVHSEYSVVAENLNQNQTS